MTRDVFPSNNQVFLAQSRPRVVAAKSERPPTATLVILVGIRGLRAPFHLWYIYNFYVNRLYPKSILVFENAPRNANSNRAVQAAARVGLTATSLAASNVMRYHAFDLRTHTERQQPRASSITCRSTHTRDEEEEEEQSKGTETTAKSDGSDRILTRWPSHHTEARLYSPASLVSLSESCCRSRSVCRFVCHVSLFVIWFL